MLYCFDILQLLQAFLMAFEHVLLHEEEQYLNAKALLEMVQKHHCVLIGRPLGFLEGETHAFSCIHFCFATSFVGFFALQ